MIKWDIGEFLTWSQSSVIGMTWGGEVVEEARCFAQELSVFQGSHMEGTASLLLAPC